VAARRIALAMLGRPAPGTAPARDTSGRARPRGYLFDEMFAVKYDESLLDGEARYARPAYRRLPAWVKLAMEVHRRRDEYDAIVTWSERLSLALMTIDWLSRGKPHVAMLYWFSRPSVRVPMRAFGARTLRGIVTWPTVQRAYAIDELGVDPSKLYLVKHFVDQLFWSSRNPRDQETDTICGAGAEMRDYPTLLDALRGTGLPCHIATDHVRVDRFGFGRRVSAEAFLAGAGGNVTIGRRSATELRDLYARSRFVVVPLRPSDTDNGVTVILEAMAMGKAVICSRTRGQVDVIQDGVTGIFVPPGDAPALRKAMQDLWNDPARARAMGERGRAYIEKHHTLDKFCRDVKAAIDACLDGRGANADGSVPPLGG
jgi:glycosyltransferase involved in cell wall biosynthesis